MAPLAGTVMLAVGGTFAGGFTVIADDCHVGDAARVVGGASGQVVGPRRDVRPGEAVRRWWPRQFRGALEELDAANVPSLSLAVAVIDTRRRRSERRAVRGRRETRRRGQVARRVHDDRRRRRW